MNEYDIEVNQVVDLTNLDYHLAGIILELVKAFAEKATNIHEGSEKYLGEIIAAFEILHSSDANDLTVDKQKIVDDGLLAFAEHFQNLWI